MKTSLAILLLISSLSAQSRIDPINQVQAPALTVNSVYAWIPGTGFLFFQFDASAFTWDMSTIPPTLRSKPPAPLRRKTIVIHPAAGATTLTIPDTPLDAINGLDVYRNGIVLEQGATRDYTFIPSSTGPGGTITFSPPLNAATGPAETFQIKYFY